MRVMDITAIGALRELVSGGTAQQDWVDKAACARTDPTVFYPGQGQRTRAAKTVCMTCPVRLDCLRWALSHNECYGVWGGLGESDRRRLRRELLLTRLRTSLEELSV